MSFACKRVGWSNKQLLRKLKFEKIFLIYENEVLICFTSCVFAVVTYEEQLQMDYVYVLN